MLAQMEVRLLWDFLPQPADVLSFSSSLFFCVSSVEIYNTSSHCAHRTLIKYKLTLPTIELKIIAAYLESSIAKKKVHLGVILLNACI